VERHVNYRGGRYYTSLLEQVRELRKNQTEAEDIFWRIVRNRKYIGLKFRRQHQIGRFITDFFCASKSLIVEIDGKIHLSSTQRERDISRDYYLQSLGYKILRFSNREIFKEIDIVLEKIRTAVL